ncbi:hypothetical protein V3C99_014839 [Haemonchus contortus]
MRKILRFAAAALAVLTTLINVFLFAYLISKEGKTTSAHNCDSGKKTQSSAWDDLLPFFPELQHNSAHDLDPVHLSQPFEYKRKKLVIGIPVAERKTDYIIETLTSLFSNLGDNYRNEILFITMFATMEISSDFVRNKSAEIRGKFADEIRNGILQVIGVPPVWYNINVDKIPATFNDSSDRMYWRTKQNIDYVYLMTYSSGLGDYYMQLEDDVIAAADYARVIFNYIAFKSRKPWFVMEFSSMGFIAKLFRCSDLKYMTHAIALYYRFKPVDWILMDILQSRYCSLDESKENCAKTIRCYVINSGTSQFQHVGKISSLTGKVQKIYDHTFGTGKSEGFRWNPFADVISSMPTAKKYEAQVGYSRNVGIWFTNVTEGSFVSILFLQPINISGIMFLSGVPPAIDDKFGPETEVYALDTEGRRTSLGRFSLNGDFLYRSDGTFVEELRIEVTETLPHWVILDHIRIDTNPECLSLIN